MPKIYPHDYAKGLKKWEQSLVYRSTHQRGSLYWRQALRIDQGSYDLKPSVGGRLQALGKSQARYLPAYS